jgi:CBS domain-containing protein
MTGTVQPHRGTYLLHPFERATVVDVMRPGLVYCAPYETLRSVARMLAEHRIHAVVVGGIDVYHGHERLTWGVVSDMDLVAHVHELDEIRAEGAASTPAVTIEATASITEAAALMTERAVSHLIVVADERPVGVISTLDIASAIAWGG